MSQTSLRILVSDRDEKLRRFVASVLADRGFQVEVCEPGDREEELYRRRFHDVLVLGEPAAPSLRILRRLRKGRDRVPAILLARKPLRTIRADGARIGGVVFLRRAFQGSELVEAVLRAADLVPPLPAASERPGGVEGG